MLAFTVKKSRSFTKHCWHDDFYEEHHRKSQINCKSTDKQRSWTEASNWRTEKEHSWTLKPESIDFVKISSSDSSFSLPIRVSSGKRILMPISTSPLSTKSLEHAVQLINNSKEPTKIQPLDSSKFHIDASKATPFKLHGTIIVPITFENNVARNFQMLVLGNLPNAIIFVAKHPQK